MIWVLVAVFVIGTVLSLVAKQGHSTPVNQGRLSPTLAANTQLVPQRWSTWLSWSTIKAWWSRQQFATLTIATAIQVFLLSNFFFPSGKDNIAVAFLVGLGVFGFCSLRIPGTWVNNGYRRFLEFALFCTVVGTVFVHVDLIWYKAPVAKNVEETLKLQFEHELKPLLDGVETLKKIAGERALTKEEVDKLKELREEEGKLRKNYELQVPQDWVARTLEDVSLFGPAISTLNDTRIGSGAPAIDTTPTPEEWAKIARDTPHGEDIEYRFMVDSECEVGPFRVADYGEGYWYVIPPPSSVRAWNWSGKQVWDYKDLFPSPNFPSSTLAVFIAKPGVLYKLRMQRK